MPESFPNVSVSKLAREVAAKVDEALAGIGKLEAEIKAEYERLRHATDTPSAAPSATESAPPSGDASEPEPTVPATPSEAQPETAQSSDTPPVGPAAEPVAPAADEVPAA